MTIRLAAYLLVFCSYLVLFLDDSTVAWLTLEDGVVESLGALFFLAAALLFLRAWWLGLQPTSSPGSQKDRFRKNVFFLLLGLLFFVSFGEEISWGQRIFNWETPETLAELNAQGETNIHNIWIINGQTSDSDPTAFFGINVNVNFYFSVFWLMFCVLIPVLDKISGGLHRFLIKLGFPVVPLWIGGLFLAHAIFFHIIYNLLPYQWPGRIDELRETNYAFMFLVLAIHESRLIVYRDE